MRLMDNFILYHYDNSPFAEKIRLLLGYKNASYKVVIIRVIMPKPDLVALTGDYRKKNLYCSIKIISV
tara:strand:- start:26719 stop:26922 length:204 start_codon:yes stop_codon:yes gene_type:complete